MKASIFTRIFGGYLVLIVALAAFVLLFSFGIIREHYLQTLTTGLTQTATALRFSIAPLIERMNLDGMHRFVGTAARETSTRITVIDSTGVVLADSEESPKKMENHKGRPEVADALAGKVGHSLRYSSTAGRETLYVAIPIQKEGTLQGVLRTSLTVRQIDVLLGSLRAHILQISLIIALIALAAAFLFSRSLLVPIREVTAAARRLADGDLNARVFLKRGDEIKELAGSFNDMAERISTLVTELSRQKEELNGIVDSIQEGLLVLDKGGKVLYSNDSFARFVQQPALEGKYFWEVLRNPQFFELIEKARRDGRSLTEEVQIGDRVYLSSVTFMPLRQELVSVLHDVTDIKNVERVKRDFVVNVSHELRTPLTAIKGFVETLEEEVSDPGKRYVDIIKRNTDRLINIVQDLLLLSELEEQGALHLEEIDVAPVLENILRIFDDRLREKHLSVKTDIGQGVPRIKADPFKLEQVFVNLIDNAIKYTEKGEIAVRIGTTGSKVIIEVHDSGIGIPRQDLRRVFERFYVVDKSRSRKFGGTGLGLSIVKHIVLLHNGSIDVDSTPGTGTTFTVTLPVDPAISS